MRRRGSYRCGSVETADGTPCRNWVKAGTQKCQSGHRPIPSGSKAENPFKALGIDNRPGARPEPKLAFEVSQPSTVDLDELESFLAEVEQRRATTPAPTYGLMQHDEVRPKKPVYQSRRIPKKTPEDKFEVTLSSHAVKQLEQVGEGAEKALDRIVGVRYRDISRMGKRLPDRGGRQFWRVRTGTVAVLFELENDEIFVQGFAPRDRPPY